MVKRWVTLTCGAPGQLEDYVVSLPSHLLQRQNTLTFVLHTVTPLEQRLHGPDARLLGFAVTSWQLRDNHVDFLIVGRAFPGACWPSNLASHGKQVLLIDKRPHIGGNAYDHPDAAGILVHDYGPHIFHTQSQKVYDYLSRFTAWRPYKHRALAHVEGKLLPMPINLDTVNKLYGWDLSSAQLEQFFAPDR